MFRDLLPAAVLPGQGAHAAGQGGEGQQNFTHFLEPQHFDPLSKRIFFLSLLSNICRSYLVIAVEVTCTLYMFNVQQQGRPSI
jgi:hypothetical protein